MTNSKLGFPHFPVITEPVFTRRGLNQSLLESLGDNLGPRDGESLLLGEVLAGDPGKGDGLVPTGLDGLGVGDLHG